MKTELMMTLTMMGLAGAGCSRSDWDLTLRLVGEDGRGLSSASVIVDGAAFEADDDGRVVLEDLDRAVLAVARAPGRLAEPVPLGPADAEAETEITLLDAADRMVLHFGGDVMLGRRYLQSEAPLLREGRVGDDARDVVADLAPALSLADLVSVNLETVVGDVDPAGAYPGKRWLLSTPPEALTALDTLGVGVVTLGNNHLYDWMDDGLVSTIASLDAAGLPHVGAGLDAEAARQPLVVEVGGRRVGVLSWTTVDGTWVNDQYPTDAEPVPEDVEAADAWVWEARTWGWQSTDGAVDIPSAPRRIGSAWAALSDAEAELDEAAVGDLWASARSVYPELQDWVARRGHGGPARWDPRRSPDDVAALADESDLTVVQLHMGFQFTQAPAAAARAAAQAAADAGADLVILHHPHVLQGIEKIDDTLVAYSLGNLVFDQDFLSTFPTGFLRVVVGADDTVEQVRFVPAWLDGYRPAPVTGDLADRVLDTLWERSLMTSTATRGSDDRVRVVADGRADAPQARSLSVRREHNTLRFLDAAVETRTHPLEADGDRAVRVPAGLLVETPLDGGAEVELGRGLLGHGGFEDDDTDLDGTELIGWVVYGSDAHPTTEDAWRGRRSLELVAQPDRGRTTARAVARAELPLHRAYADADGALPLDPAPSYSVRLHAWAAKETDLGLVRVALYDFDDSNPVVAPASALIDEVELPFSVPAREWTAVELELPAERLVGSDGVRANMALVYLSASEPAQRSSLLRVDDVELIEWRRADRLPAGFMRADFVRGGAGTLVLPVLDGGRR